MAYELGGVKKRPWWDLFLESFGVGASIGVGTGALMGAASNPFKQPDLPISPIVPSTFPPVDEPIKKKVPMRRRDTLLAGAKRRETLLGEV